MQIAGRTQNADDTVGDFALDGVGRASHLAVQPQLGLLPEQRTGHRGSYPAGFAFARPNLKIRRQLRLVRGLSVLATERAISPKTGREKTPPCDHRDR